MAIAVTPVGDGTEDLLLQEESPPRPPAPAVLGHRENIADHLDETILQEIAQSLIGKVDDDFASREPWMEQVTRALELLGVGPEAEPDHTDFDQADTTSHDLLLKSLVRFQSRAISEMLPQGEGVYVCRVKSLVDLDALPPEQREEAEKEIGDQETRVKEFFTDYLLNKLDTYYEDHDQTIYETGLTGASFKTVFVDPTRPDAPVQVERTPVENVGIAYNAVSLRTSRLTRRIEMLATDLLSRIENGTYRVPENITLIAGVDTTSVVTAARDKLQGVQPSSVFESETHSILEVQAYLLLDSDPESNPLRIPRPYIVTLHEKTQSVLAIYRNWADGDPVARPLEHMVGYLFHPGESAVLGWGLGHLLANTTEALRKALRRTLEAGHLQNLPGGFKSAKLSIRRDAESFVPGMLKDVDIPAESSIRDSIYMLQFPGPSPGLIQLMQMLQESGEELGDVATMDVSEMLRPNVPLGSVLALLDESSAFPTAVKGRLYRSQAREYRLIQQAMIGAFGNVDVQFGANKVLKAGDLEAVEIKPAIDPKEISKQRRLLTAQALQAEAEKSPDIVDRRKATRSLLVALGADPDYYIVEPAEAKPADAITEYRMALGGAPLKAGWSQNHQAHSETHLSQLRMVANSNLPVERGTAVSQTLASHIAEHMALDLAVQVASRMGIELSVLEKGIPPEIEAEIAPQIAKMVQEVEALRVAPGEGDVRTRIAEIQAQSKQQAQFLEAQESAAKRFHEVEEKRKDRAHEMEMLRFKEGREDERNEEDNETVIEAAMIGSDRQGPKSQPGNN